MIKSASGSSPCRTLDHDHIVFGADVNKIEIALCALRVRRVRDELSFDAANAHGADRAGKRNIRNGQRGGCAVHRQNVRIVLAVGAEQDRDDLRIVKVSLWKERPYRPIDHARGERFLFRGTTFALEVAAREFSDCCGLFAIINREREIILAFFDFVAETALASTMVSPHVTMTAPSASLAILPVSIEIGVAPIWAVTFCCILLFLDVRFQAGHPDCRF